MPSPPGFLTWRGADAGPEIETAAMQARGLAVVAEKAVPFDSYYLAVAGRHFSAAVGSRSSEAVDTRFFVDSLD